MKNIASKKDILDMSIGIKTFTEGSSVPSPGLLIGGLCLHFDDLQGSGFSEGDTFTIDGDVYTFKSDAEGDFELSLQLDAEALIRQLRESIIPGYLANDNVPNISVNMQNFIYINPINSSLLSLSNIDNAVDGDTLTLGEITYTFKETPTEQYDIDVANPSDNFLAFLVSTPNPILRGYSVGGEPGLFFVIDEPFICTSSIDSVPTLPGVFKVPGIKTIDIHKSVNVFNLNDVPGDLHIFRLPSAGVEGNILKLVNVGTRDVFISSSQEIYQTITEVDSNSYTEIIYFKNSGWRRIVDGQITTLFNPV